jgi:phosphate transport system substrate-binding protein
VISRFHALVSYIHQRTCFREKLYRSIAIAAFLLLLAGCAGPIGGTATDLNGHILVAGSTALQPLATKAATLFQQQHAHVHIEVKGGGSLVGLQAVTTHQADIGDSDIYADPATYPDPDLTDHLVCIIPFTMIASPGVTIPSLTKQQIIDIFSTGIIRNWKQVGGPDLPIVPVVRPPTSGTRATFRKYILDGRDEIGTLLTSDSSATVLNKVATTRGAIGYLAVSVLNSSVHPIAIDGQNATLQNIEAGRYSFWGYEHMYTLGEDNPIAAAFLSFMLTPQVQQVALELKYIPIADIKFPQFGLSQQEASLGYPPIPYESEIISHEYL